MRLKTQDISTTNYQQTTHQTRAQLSCGVFIHSSWQLEDLWSELRQSGSLQFIHHLHEIRLPFLMIFLMRLFFRKLTAFSDKNRILFLNQFLNKQTETRVPGMLIFEFF